MTGAKSVLVAASAAVAIAAAAIAASGSAQNSGTAQNADGGRAAVAPSWLTPAPNAQRGQELAQVCLTCHQANSPQTDPPAPRLLHQRQSYVFRALLEYRQGERKSDIMAPFAQGLSDQDMRDIAAYVAGDMLDQPPRARAELPGYAIAATQCHWCHGETGIGEFEGMPVLTGQKADYLQLALAEYRSGQRTDPTMRAVAQQLDAARDADLARYFAAHEWLEDGQ